MDRDNLQKLFKNCGLGAITATPKKVTGGLIHRMWRVETISGVYAVKQLNAEIMKRPNIEQAYILSERIAAAYAQKGISAIPAIMHNGNPLYRCGDDMVMIYNWVEAGPVAIGRVDCRRSFMVGKIMASLHKYQPDMPRLEPPWFKGFDEAYWQNLSMKARQKRLSWRHEFELILPEIISLSALYDQAADELRSEAVISHRDLDLNNVLWTADDNPVVIDWEAAGMTNPALELLDGALNWSGFAEGEKGTDLFEAFINGYLKVNKAPVTSGREALIGVLGAGMNWLEFNIRRALGDGDSVENKRGNEETISTMKTIRTVHAQFEQLADRYETLISR